MSLKSKKSKEAPTVAPGMRDFLEKKATPEEIKKGHFTRVTNLSFDETH